MKPLIKKIISYAEKELSNSELSLFTDFVCLYYSQAHLDDFEDQKPQSLYRAAVSHWQLLKHRHFKELKVRVFNPDIKRDGWKSLHTVIEVVIQDMPFIVDSMRMELNRMGITIHTMVYMGGMKVKRDHQGNVLNILNYNARVKNVDIESPIYMEIDQQTGKAALNKIKNCVINVLQDVCLSVNDWGRMQQRLQETIDIISSSHMPQKLSEVRETVAFLKWMLEEHFIFLGARDYQNIVSHGEKAMGLISGSGLGVLSDESCSKILRRYSELPIEAREIALAKDQILIISKTNTRSTVHRSAYTDYIGIKLFDEKGNIVKERRFIGLYTSLAYTMNPKEIPFIRKKVASIFKRSGLPVCSHAGKDLMHILSTLPRDDLFQGTVDEIYSISMGILHLQERRKIRLFMRKDAYDRYVSCLVYLPRENFNTDILHCMMSFLRKKLHGTEVSFDTYFSSSILARIHFVIRLTPGKVPQYNVRELEKKLAEIGQSWHDSFYEIMLNYFGEELGSQIISKYQYAFPASYREAFFLDHIVKDIEYIESLSKNNLLGMSFYRPTDAALNVIKFKLFHKEQTVPLSDALPMLENMGLRVIGEQPYCIVFQDSSCVWINDFSMTYLKEPSFEVEQVKEIFQEAFYKIWLGEAENDAFNRLVLEAQLAWREIAMLRAYARYLKQISFTYSAEYIAETLVKHAEVARLLKDLFMFRFKPEKTNNPKSQDEIKKTEKLIEESLDHISVLDEDRILRRYVELIYATLRTNYYQTDSNGHPKPYISFKLDPSKLSNLPLPLPKFEIFVYSPRFEGVHLRADKVARGGIRWSDRREDFRTEILGLMKAQCVKNAVIVPAGAKGGFVPKCLPEDGSREQVLEEGLACYRQFIQSLLDLTDDLKGDHIISPSNVVYYDNYDPYLVVAADKGTATFSDAANAISMNHNFWLGDAFASGSSTGYDHKKIGITAHGAWISVEQHFQELGVNIGKTEITVVGIGDMSGDVFGNGMLLSRHLKLVAAFNHLHIFIDPDPDPEVSFKERRRLFHLPRSSWQDYNAYLISKGGGVFRRDAKSILITPEIQSLLDVDENFMLPDELIRSILKASVDLLWNAGIGTYVKSSKELNNNVGDRTNDNVRINGKDLNARVVCEGGNLGLTQLGRIEYELNGGRINTDFIDNSAGVDCSDHEVNAKILLNMPSISNELDKKQRNDLLIGMTDEVAKLVLQNNYHQNRAISLASFLSPRKINLYMRYLDIQEQEGKINRHLEFLPSSKDLSERKLENLGFTRPEIAVLFSYSKIILEKEIRHSDLPEDHYLSQCIKNAFAIPLRKRYLKFLDKHRLHREIIATQLSNQIVSNMGFTFVFQMQDETGASTSSIVRAYTIAHNIYRMEDFYADIESLDYRVDARVQMQMTNEVIELIYRATRWFLRNHREYQDIQAITDDFSQYLLEFSSNLPQLILGNDKTCLEEKKDTLVAANVTPEIAARNASAEFMYYFLDIIDAAKVQNVEVYCVAKIYFILLDHLDLLWFRDQISKFPADSRWTLLAKAGYKDDLDRIQRKLTISILNFTSDIKNIHSQIKEWFNKNDFYIKQWQLIIADIKASTKKDFEIFAVAIGKLSELVQVNKNLKR